MLHYMSVRHHNTSISEIFEMAGRELSATQVVFNSRPDISRKNPS